MDTNSLKHPIHSGPFVSKFGSYKKYRQYCLDEGLAKITKNGVFLFGNPILIKNNKDVTSPVTAGLERNLRSVAGNKLT